MNDWETIVAEWKNVRTLELKILGFLPMFLTSCVVLVKSLNLSVSFFHCESGECKASAHILL